MNTYHDVLTELGTTKADPNPFLRRKDVFEVMSHENRSNVERFCKDLVIDHDVDKGDASRYRTELYALRKMDGGRLSDYFLYGHPLYCSEGWSERLIFSREAWHIYAHGVWEVKDEQVIIDNLIEVARRWANHTGDRFVSSAVKESLSIIRGKSFVDDSRLDKLENKINLRNGVFDLSTGKLLDHSPHYYYTSQIPVDYDRKAACQEWIEYLTSTFGYFDDKQTWQYSKDLAEMVCAGMAYSLTQSMRYELMFWALGEGRNGKGVLFHVMEHLCGGGGTHINMNTLERNDYQLAMLPGKTAAFCTEADTDARVKAGEIKTLVSGEPMMVRQIRERPFVLRNTAKIWWSFNNLPNIRDTSDGFWRRVRVIPFNRTFTETEARMDLKDVLTSPEALSGILNHVLAVYVVHSRKDKFPNAKMSIEVTEEYRSEEDIVLTFIDELCETNDPLFEEKSGSVYDSYRFWCSNNGFMAKSVKSFKREMKRLGYNQKRKSAGMYYVGVKLKPSHPSSIFRPT